MRFHFNKYITSIAHRGYSGKYKGNSLLAFKKAYDRNFDMIELDIQACKSGELIVHHDPFIKYNSVNDLTLKDIKSLDKSILTFKEFLTNLPYKKKSLYLDLKGGEKTAYNLFAFIKTWDIDYKNMIAFSFNMEHLNLLKNKLPNLKRGLITSNKPDETLLKYIENNVDYISLSYDILDHELIKKIKTLDKIIYTFTLSTKKEANYVKNFDIDGVVSDFKVMRSFYN